MKKLLLAMVCCLLIACGDSNPLIGTWKGSVDVGNDMIKQGLGALGVSTEMQVQFTDKEIISTHGGRESRQAIRYRIEKDKVYITEDTGKTEKSETWTLVPMKDKNTIEFPIMAGMSATLTRVP